MSLKDDILSYISQFPGATDAEIAKALAKIHQQVNRTCRSLEKQGFIIRMANPQKSDYIGNYLGCTPIEARPIQEQPIEKPSISNGEPLQEEDIKYILYDYLTQNGWTAKVAWGHNPGVDIDAHKDGVRWLIEIKGPGSRPPMRVNYFIGILGETLQRMDDPNARYTIVFPDMPQYRKLWDRLPALAKARTTIDMILVGTDGSITEYH
ncbi:MAG: MarR family transcriptional regulator [Oscillospiraceae bacterium]|nr:MarR family transcriptional regulator [Oscillospiraceae bacterium]